MHQGFADILDAGTGVGGGADVHGDLVVMAKRRQQRDGDHRAFALRQLVAGPDIAPGTLDDERLKWGIEGCLCGLGPVDMRVSKHGTAGFHASFIAIGHGEPPVIGGII